jgi:hypothetical protein
VVFSNSALLAGPGYPSRSAVLLEGEELVYNVRYSIIDLGQIRIRTLGKSRTANAVSYNGKAYIDSYESIPFVDAHAVFESAIDSTVFSRGFVGRSKEGDYWDFTRYSMDYSAKRLYMEFGGRDSVVQKRDTLELAGTVQDGLSLFFFARDRLMANRAVHVPVIIKDREYNCTINFRNDRRTAEVDAINYPIDVVHFDGTADFVGFYGLTGDFEGWFSNDDARVPILAKMRVLIGSVTIELIEWKRVGWVPPKAAE